MVDTRSEPPATGRHGIAPSLAARLARLGIRASRDLVLHLPLRYEDETRLTRIADAREGGMVQVEGDVTSCEVALRPRRQLVARIDDGSATLVARWLNFYPSLQKQLEAGRRVRLFGEVRGGFFGDEMVHPRVRPVSAGEALPDALTPVYPTTAGLAQSALRKLVSRSLAALEDNELLPPDVVRDLALPGFAPAVRALHHPPPDADADQLEARTHPAWRRIKFEELLVQQLSLRRAYMARRAHSAVVLAAQNRLTRALLGALPFALTTAQQRADRKSVV